MALYFTFFFVSLCPKAFFSSCLPSSLPLVRLNKVCFLFVLHSIWQKYHSLNRDFPWTLILRIHDRSCTRWRKQQPINLRIWNGSVYSTSMPSSLRSFKVVDCPDPISLPTLSLSNLAFLSPLKLEPQDPLITSLPSYRSWQGFSWDGSTAQRNGNRNHKSGIGNYRREFSLLAQRLPSRC